MRWTIGGIESTENQPKAKAMTMQWSVEWTGVKMTIIYDTGRCYGRMVEREETSVGKGS